MSCSRIALPAASASGDASAASRSARSAASEPRAAATSAASDADRSADRHGPRSSRRGPRVVSTAGRGRPRSGRSSRASGSVVRRGRSSRGAERTPRRRGPSRLDRRGVGRPLRSILARSVVAAGGRRAGQGQATAWEAADFTLWGRFHPESPGVALPRSGPIPRPSPGRHGCPEARISKSRSFSSTLNSSRARRRASSTVLPENSFVGTHISVVPLVGPDGPASRGRIVFEAVVFFVRVGQDGRALAWLCGGGMGSPEFAGVCSAANRGVQPNNGNIAPQPTMRYCWIIEKHRGCDPVDEQAGWQEAAVGDGDQRQEQHRLTLDLGVWAVIWRGPRRATSSATGPAAARRMRWPGCSPEHEGADRDAEERGRLADIDPAEPRMIVSIHGLYMF